MKDQTAFFMRRAIALSAVNVKKGRGGPFGALVVKDGKIIAEGANGVTSRNDPTAHAEVTAIRKACKKLKTFQLKGCVIYTSCEPCPMCLAAIYWARPDRVYFANTKKDAAKIGFDDGFIYREIEKPLARRKLKMRQVLRDEALGAFKDWKNNPDKVPY
jgi:tRNA(Arg) A34 adenosine deaminase TadA